MAKSEITKILSERLEKLTEQKRDSDYKLSDKKQADQMGIPYPTFNKYKGDSAECPISTVVKMAKYYNVSTDYLLGLTDNTTIDPEVKTICEYTGLNEESVNKLHEDFKPTRYIELTKDCKLFDRDNNPDNIFKILNLFISRGYVQEIAAILFDLEKSSDKLMKLVGISETAEPVNYAGNMEEIIKYMSEVEDADNACDIKRYKLVRIIENISNLFDQREQVKKQWRQREQVKNNGNNNPTNK